MNTNSNTRTLKNIIFPTSELKILSFFTLHPEDSFHVRELSRRTKLSLGGTNKALASLYAQGLLDRKPMGSNLIYTLNRDDLIVRRLGILSILTELESLVKKLAELSSLIILFGSFPRGENMKGSDIDLLIVGNPKDEIQDIVDQFEKDRGEDFPKIQAIIRTPIEWMALEDKDPVFFSEVNKGIALWDKQRNER
jgi:predicted nucleotidyltransferase